VQVIRIKCQKHGSLSSNHRARCYINSDVLSFVSCKGETIVVKIPTREVSSLLKTLAESLNKQYGELELRSSTAFSARDRLFYE
jgi:hypothetical protein